MELECEALFLVDAERFQRILSGKAFPVSPMYPDASCFRQARLYFDTPLGELREGGHSLCIARDAHAVNRLLYKRALKYDTEYGVLTKEEVRADCTPEGFPADLTQRVAPLAQELFPRFMLDSYRVQYLAREAAPRFYISFDEVVVRSLDGAKLAAYWAIELEQTDEIEELSPCREFHDLVQRFERDHALEACREYPSKYEIGARYA